MALEEIKDLSKLCIHTITTKPWPIEEAIRNYASSGVKGITVWREALENRNPTEISRRIADCGIQVISLCRGGFFPAVDAQKRKTAIDENLRAIDEAAALEAPLIVLVGGADPAQPLEVSRNQILEGIQTILPHAVSCGVRLAIEPLHPMYADSRSAVNTLRQAREMCQRINSPWLGIAVDVYHLWWDQTLEEEIRHCGCLQKLFAFHICDWRTPTVDLLNDRGLMGEGCIPIRRIRGWMEDSGFDGFREVEIFSHRWWQTDQSLFLKQITEAYLHFS